MVGDEELLRALEPVLRLHEGVAPGAMVVLRRMVRRRSVLYFVGSVADPETCRWVVKAPTVEAQRLGIRPPMSAADQLAAVQRLHEFLSHGDGRLGAPRPVGLLPEVDALVMECVDGRSLWELVGLRALLDPAALLAGVRASAVALRHLHGIAPTRVLTADLGALHRAVAADSAAALRGVGLQVQERWLPPAEDARPTPGCDVLLHGDWAPENVMLTGEGVMCLDPELTDRGWAEHDVARFLLMLLDRPVFLVSEQSIRGRRLRSAATAAFVSAYYGAQPVSPLLRPLLLREVSRRWAVRHSDLQGAAPRLFQARQWLLRRYFTALLDELGDPRWTAGAADGPDLRRPRPG